MDSFVILGKEQQPDPYVPEYVKSAEKSPSNGDIPEYVNVPFSVLEVPTWLPFNLKTHWYESEYDEQPPWFKLLSYAIELVQSILEIEGFVIGQGEQMVGLVNANDVVLQFESS